MLDFAWLYRSPTSGERTVVWTATIALCAILGAVCLYLGLASRAYTPERARDLRLWGVGLITLAAALVVIPRMIRRWIER